MAMDIEKIKKVVEMANKASSKGERENAQRIIKKFCAVTKRKYEDVMEGRWETEKKYTSSNQNTQAYTNYQTAPRGCSAGRPMRSRDDMMRDINWVKDKQRQNAQRLQGIRERLRKQGII